LSIAVDSYLQKIAPPEDITSNISFRTTIDHIAAIFIPLIGGVLWTRVGHQATFYMGIGIVAGALIVTQFLGRSMKAQEETA
jgi:predicted MFS family arabinose efflux permease